MGKLYVVATPIGNLGDITLRALDVLKDVDLILCEDTRHSLKLLNHFNIKKSLISYHKFNEKEQSKKIITKMKNDDLDVALITDAGTPCISDPGVNIVALAIKEEIDVIPIGGISAVITSLSVSGFDCSNFGFYGFFPRENKERLNILKKIKTSDINIHVFYESPKRIITSLDLIYDILGNVEICVCSDMTKLHEKKYYGSIKDVVEDLKINENSDLGEYTFIIKTEVYEEKISDYSLEAKLIDVVVKEGLTLKEATNYLAENSNISKKMLYNACLNLKEIFK